MTFCPVTIWVGSMLRISWKPFSRLEVFVLKVSMLVEMVVVVNVLWRIISDAFVVREVVVVVR